MSGNGAAGAFITFEGVEGSGKSTQIALLHAWLAEQGRGVLVTREPGGTPVAEAVRGILLDPAHTGMSGAAELLLYAAARADHVHRVIRPALEAGNVVLCDRYVDSTLAYQGHARGLGEDAIRRLHDLGTGGLWPGLTFVLDLPAAAGLERARTRGRRDRIEREALDFHERVRAGFLQLGKVEPARIKILDGLQPVEALAAEVRAVAGAFLPRCAAP
jgi:dTMP kinase